MCKDVAQIRIENELKAPQFQLWHWSCCAHGVERNSKLPAELLLELRRLLQESLPGGSTRWHTSFFVFNEVISFSRQTMIIFKLQHRKNYHFAVVLENLSAISSSQKPLKIDTYTFITQLGDPALKHTRAIRHYSNCFPWEHLLSLQGGLHWRLQVWQWIFYDLAGRITPSPHTCAWWNAPLDSHSNSSLENRQREELIPNRQHPQQRHSRQLQAKWHLRGTKTSPTAKDLDRETSTPRGAERPNSTPPLAQRNHELGMCLPGDKEKLLSSDHRSEKFLNYTPRSLTRDEIQHFKILEGRHCAKTHIKAQPP